MSHRFTWYGHSTFKLETSEGKTILIDPFFDGNPSAPIVSGAVSHADCICVTHDHSDHVGQALEIAKKTGATVIGVFDTIQKFLSQGLPKNQGLGMNIGGTVLAANARIKMVQAMHSSASGVASGYIMTLEDGFCLYHAGDTGIFSSMNLFSQFHKIDLAILPIGGHFTMDSEQAAYACRMLKPNYVVPMHWGTFSILEQSTISFSNYLTHYAPDVKLFSPMPGQTISLEKKIQIHDSLCK